MLETEKFRKYLNATVHSVWHGWDAYMKYAQKLWYIADEKDRCEGAFRYWLFVFVDSIS
jgi:hypothetical protein